MDDIDLGGLFEGLFQLIACVPELLIWLITTVYGWITTLVIAALIFCAIKHNESNARERARQRQEQEQKVEQ